MMNDPLRRTGYFFRTDDEIYFTPSEYSYFRKKEDLDSFVAWFDHVQESYILADLEPKEDHNFVRKLYLIREQYKKFFDQLCEFEQRFDPSPITHPEGQVQMFNKNRLYKKAKSNFILIKIMQSMQHYLHDHE